MIKRPLLSILVLVFFIIGCTPKQGEPLPQKGLLWEIRGNGLANSSYLFGTAHLAEGMQILDSIKNIDSIFGSINQLVSEYHILDLLEYINQEKEYNHSLLKPWPNPDSTYHNLLTTKQKTILDADPKASELFEKLENAKLNVRPLTFLDILKVDSENKSKNDKTEPLVLDAYLQGLAKKRNLKIASLDFNSEFQSIKESMYSQLSPISYRDEVDILMDFIEKGSEMDSVENSYLNKLMTAYLKQDIHFLARYPSAPKVHHNKILSYLEKDGFMKLQKELFIDERNNLWMNKIPNLINDHPSLIAVGAAHLGGEKGLINQLREQGYTVTSISQDY